MSEDVFAIVGKLRIPGTAFAWQPVRIPVGQRNRMSDRQPAYPLFGMAHPDVLDDDFISPERYEKLYRLHEERRLHVRGGRAGLR